MLLQAAPRHELVDKKPVLFLVAIADQFDEVWMPHLPKENDFSLPRRNKQINNPSQIDTGQHIQHLLSILRNILTANTYSSRII
jgi:hypothetical protein